jgi:RHS repeat-associated protein
MLQQSRSFFRFLALVTLLTFFPSSVAVWNFIPPIQFEAEAQEIDDSLPNGESGNADSPGNAVTPPKVLTEEELRNLSGGPGAAQEEEPSAAQRLHLADARAVGEELDVAPHEPALLGRLLVAQANPIDLPAGDSSLTSRVSEAVALQNGDNNVDAYAQAVEIVDDYPNPTLPEVWTVLEMVKNIPATASERDLNALEANLPSLRANLTSAYVIDAMNTLYEVRAKQYEAQGNTAQRDAYLDVFAAESWRLVDEFPDTILAYFNVEKYGKAMKTLGREEESLAAMQTYAESAPVSVARSRCWLWFARIATEVSDHAGARLYFMRFIDDVAAGGLDGVFNDPTVVERTKAGREYHIATAYMYIEPREALAWYQSIVDRYPVEEEFIAQNSYAPVLARYQVANLTTLENPEDHYGGVLRFSEFLREFPASPAARKAVMQIAGLYMLSGDYSQSASYYQRVISEYPDTEEAEVAAAELNFLMTYLYGTVEVAAGKPVEVTRDAKVAQMCGPSALQKLLETQGIQATQEELAAVAGTDETGTTMLGLVDAAKAKGLDVAGVESPDPERLAQPFIAYVNGNHFLLVREVRDDAIVVSDMDKPDAGLTRAEFARMWDGKALVVERLNSQLASALDPDTQKKAKGGMDYEISPNPPNPPPCEEGDCGCPEDSGDGKGPNGTKLRAKVCNKRTGKCRMRAGNPKCPEAESGVYSPGVNPSIYPSSTTFKVDETDLSIAVRGDNGLAFSRILMNEKGYYRSRFTDNTKPWSNNVGKGWTHEYNIHLVTSTPVGGKPATVVFYDEKGTDRTYSFSYTDSGIHYYVRNSTGSSSERGYWLMLDSSTGKYTLTMPGGREYRFSAATNDIYRFARLETIADISGNELTLEYNGVVGTGKLTKVSPPSGDSRYLQFSYSGNQITKVELKKSAGVLQTIQYAFNGSNELTKVTDDESHDVVYGYNTFGSAPTSRFLTKITDKAGRDTDFTYTFGYSGGYQATKVQLDNAAGLRTTYDRSISTGVAVATSSKSGTTKNKFGYTPVTGDMSRAASLDYFRYTGGNWNTYHRVGYEYDAATKARTKSTMGAVTVQEASYNSSGRVSDIRCIKAPCGAGTVGGGATGVYYDTAASLYPTRRTGPDGLDIYYYYDSNWRVTKITHPSVAAAGYQFAYDAYGQVTTVTDPLNHSTTLDYDAVGNVTSVTDPNNSTNTMYYDDYGNVTRITNPLNKDTYYYYAYGGCGGCGGGGNQLTKVKDALNNETEMQYDLDGNLTKIIDALDWETDYAYDTMGQLTLLTSPSGSGNTATMAYDDIGNMTSATDFGGITTTYEYDHLGQVTKVSDPIGDVEATYDSLGNVSTLTDGLDQTTTYDYDGNNLLTKTTYANAKVTRHFYDDVGRMTKDGAGASGTVDPTELFFSGNTGLLTKIAYTSGGSTSYANYYYDGRRALTKLTDWIDGTDGLRYAYDPGGRLTTLTDYDDSTLEYTYDGAGNVLTMEDYHGSTTSYTYTDLGQVSTLTAPGSKVWDYDYNALGQPTNMSIPNGMTTAYGYDTRNRLTKIEHKDGANVVQGFTYTLDDNNLVLTVDQADGSKWDYEYDDRYRLTQAERYDTNGTTLLHRFSYTYDAGDSLVTKAVYDGTDTITTTFACDASNELTSLTVDGTTTSFAYDSWGRQTSKTQGGYSATYEYGPVQSLSKVTSDFPGEGTVTYAVGGDGMRRQRSVGMDITWYNYTVDETVISEEDGSDNLQRSFIGRTLAHSDGSNPSTGTWTYYLHDHLGSTRDLRDGAKSQVASFEFSPYGDVYASSGSTGGTSRWFTGHEWDATADLYQTTYRNYSPTQGIWLARDPLGMIDSTNVYAYVANNPIVFNDPDGGGLTEILSDFVPDSLLRGFGGHGGDYLDRWAKCVETCDPLVDAIALGGYTLGAKIAYELVY